MKAHVDHHGARASGPLLLLPLCFAAFAITAPAQSAGNFSADEVTKKVVAEVSAEAEAESSSGLLEEPSRYIGIDLDAYLQTMANSFSMRGRTFDPFGRHQDPNYAPPKPVAPTNPGPRYAPAPVTPFVDIIAAIPVTMVMPAEKSFLVGQRTFRVGDRISLNTGGAKLLPVHVVAVGSGSVTMRNGETNETAQIKLGMVPPGMTRGSASAPPGVVPAGTDSPLLIDPPSTFSSSR